MAAAQTMPTLFEMPAAATPAAAAVLPVPTPSRVASENSLFELDAELDFLLEQIEDEIEEHGEATPESMKRMQLFCQAMNVKVDRIGHSTLSKGAPFCALSRFRRQQYGT